MAIVTIAHEMGSGGPEIGMALAQRLRYRFVDREMLTRAAEKYGVGEERLSQLDETKPTLLERFDVETRHFLTVLQSALFDEADADDVVINSRGGFILLRGISHALRTRVIAPFDLRAKRYMKKIATQGETVDQRTTAEMIRARDREQHGRVRYLFDVDWSDPAQYDLVINTEKLTVDMAVDFMAGLLQRPELVATEASRQAVRDRGLASRVRAALAKHPETRKYRINVDARDGVVQLEGTAALEQAAEITRTVGGVVNVKAQLLEVPPIPPFVA